MRKRGSLSPEEIETRILRIVRRESPEGISLADLVKQIVGIDKTAIRDTLQTLETQDKIEVEIINKQGWKRFRIAGRPTP